VEGTIPNRARKHILNSINQNIIFLRFFEKGT
jgi:hypothetical protein